MNSKIYLEGLESLEDDIQPGLLSELRMDTPERLHSSVMAQIHKEKKKKFYMNYRFYMPVAAAMLVAAIFINGGRNFVNQLYPGNHAADTIHTPQTGQQGTLPGTAVLEPTVTPKGDQSNNNIIASITPSAPVKGNSGTKSNNTASATKKPSSSEQNTNTASDPANDKSVAMNGNITGSDITSGNNTGSQNAEKDSNINLEITASSQSEIISFLNSQGTLIEDGVNKVYKLDISHRGELNVILGSGTAKAKLLNSTYSGEDFIIRLVINK